MRCAAINPLYETRPPPHSHGEQPAREQLCPRSSSAPGPPEEAMARVSVGRASSSDAGRAQMRGARAAAALRQHRLRAGERLEIIARSAEKCGRRSLSAGALLRAESGLVTGPVRPRQNKRQSRARPPLRRATSQTATLPTPLNQLLHSTSRSSAYSKQNTHARICCQQPARPFFCSLGGLPDLAAARRLLQEQRSTRCHALALLASSSRGWARRGRQPKNL